MKLVLDSMPQLIAAAQQRVDARFTALDVEASRKERIWIYKRAEAQKYLDGDGCDQAFMAEAEARGLSVGEFAQFILTKPQVDSFFKDRELLRQKALLQLEACKDPEQLKQVEANVRYYNG